MLSRLTFEWDAERRVLDLSDVKTHVDHRGNGHARPLLSALVDVLPAGAVVRALGPHNCEGLGWMRSMRERHGYVIHQGFWCFRQSEPCSGVSDPSSCPAALDERVARTVAT